MKLLKYLGVFVLVIVILAIGAVYFVLQQAVPAYSGEIQVSSLTDSVTVIHDEYGVPHIYAKNNEDAYKALGYLHAQERLFQMEILRRVGGGKLAEILGEDVLPIDKLFRTLGVNEAAKRAADQQFSVIDEDYKKYTMAYLSGINEFIDEGATPPEFLLLGIEKQHFTPTDVFRIVGYMSFSFALALRTEPILTEIYNTVTPEMYWELKPHLDSTHFMIPTFSNVVDSFSGGPNRTATALDSNNLSAISEVVNKALEIVQMPLFMGSNAWVVGPTKTKNKAVLFCNDAHIAYSQPSVWWEAHIETPNFNLYGNHLAGYPFALIGHTRNHAWGLTMFENDDMDLYYEEILGDSVRHKNTWVELKTRVESYTIKGKTEPVLDTVYTTPHGPIINSINDQLTASKPVSVQWTYTKLPSLTVKSAYGFTHSKSIDEFKSYVAMHNAPGLNIMYGDAQGNIAWWAAARLPIRSDSTDSKLINEGNSGAHDWLGYYPFSENPMSENPSSGYVYSANNQPDKVYNGKLYPGYYYGGARGLAISTFIESSEAHTTETMKELLLNTKGPFHIEIIQALTSDLTASSELHQQALNEIIGWDGNHNLQAIAPTIYYRFVYNFIENALTNVLSPQQFENFMKTFVKFRSIRSLALDKNASWFHSGGPNGTYQQCAQKAFDKAIQQIRLEHGDALSDWVWENQFYIEHEHPLGKVSPLNYLFNVGPHSTTGGLEVVNKQTFSMNAAGMYKAIAGPSKRIVIDFANVESAESVIPTGQSGHVLSPHYSDQFIMHAEGKFRPMFMNEQQIKSSNNNKLYLIP